MIICTEYVDPKMAMLLKDSGIQFLDLAGNAYLNSENIFVYIQGQTKTAGLRRRENSGRALQSAGLKLCFELMQNPQLADRTYRELAGIAGISLYAVKCVMDDLADKGFLDRRGKQRRLCRIDDLLDEWCVAYRDRLRPELIRGTYQSKDIDWWQSVDFKSVPACWGGEVAATKLGFMRKPQIHTVYCKGNVNALIAAGKLHRQDKGDVELLDTFWHNPKGDLAPDPVVYADLLTSGVERNIETAKELYAQRIKNRFA